MIYCSATNQRAKGLAAEHSPAANNYRAKILGGLLVQLVLRSASQDRGVAYTAQRIDCDNEGVVKHGNTASHPLKEKQPQSDLLRYLKHLIQANPLSSRL